MIQNVISSFCKQAPNTFTNRPSITAAAIDEVLQQIAAAVTAEDQFKATAASQIMIIKLLKEILDTRPVARVFY